MRQGVRPEINNATGVSGAIILLHGYCSTENPWKGTGDFTNAYYFLQSKASSTNDQFAQLVLQFAANNGISSFSLIGHSQGGSVATHIHNYYWSGADYVNQAAGRIIQSVGTPYKGNSAAGSAANLGSMFGVGCGSNFDLTADGSSLWLSGIAPASRSQVYYYTTTYKQGTFFGDYCSMAMNMILQWPNDGTTELVYAHLPGSNNLGNKEKWCHITGLAYPAQYLDHQRNKEMNAAAAR